MAVPDYLTTERILLRTRVSKTEMLEELIQSACAAVSSLDINKVREKVFEREKGVSTNIAQGVAIPHAILEELPFPVIALGVCREGIEWEKRTENPVHVVVLLLGNKMSHLSVLSEVARTLSSPKALNEMRASQTAEEIFDTIKRYDTRPSPLVADRNADVSLTIFRNGWDIARSVGGKVVLYADAVLDTPYIERLTEGTETIIVTTDPSRFTEEYVKKHTIVEIPIRGGRRSVHMQFALLYLLSRKVLEADEAVVNVYGLPESGLFDSIRLTCMDTCFDFRLPLKVKDVASDFGRHVLTRVLKIAGDLAGEGREGKPVGALFVVGDHENVKPYIRQLIINPFNGYDEQLRNIIDPSLDETIKEFTKIDGAFVIRDDGVIVSCGTYISGMLKDNQLPSGLGARHAAAMSITGVTDAFAVALSESTRKISVYHAGQKIVEI